MRKLIIANWKMNMPNLKPWRNLSVPKNVEVVICPPFPYLRDVHNLKSGARLGAQDAFWEEKGPFTGEVSPEMIKDVGGEYVIIGHSEHRKWLKETDETVNKKVRATLEAGLKVILCVGESLAIRRKGIAKAEGFVRSELKKDLMGLSARHKRRVIIAYEPIWAISTSGTGKRDTPQDAANMIKYIKGIVGPKSRALYGGSVDAKNARSFLKEKDIDGALVGGASLKVKEFKKIINISSKYR